MRIKLTVVNAKWLSGSLRWHTESIGFAALGRQGGKRNCFARETR
jgi:hypothetical protein